jgi:hypothetical protein
MLSLKIQDQESSPKKGPALSRSWSLSEIDKSKSSFNRGKGEIDFDTGIELKKNTGITLSVTGIDGDRNKMATLSPGPMKAVQGLRKGAPSGPKNPVPLRSDSGPSGSSVMQPDHNLYAERRLPFGILSPRGGERWQRCSIQTITWAQTEPPASNPSIKLIKGTYEYRVSYHSPEYDAGSDSYSVRFSVPGDIPTGSGARVRIETTAAGELMSRESGDVTIEENPIHEILLDEPNGGETWHHATSNRIRWHVDGEIDGRTPWEVELIKGGSVVVTYPHSSIETWGLFVDPGIGHCYTMYPVNPSIEMGDDYTIRVRAAGRSVGDTSDGAFSIADRPDAVDLRPTTSPLLIDLGHTDYVAEPGWTVRLKYGIDNSGNRETPPFEVAFYLSRGRSVGADAVQLAVREHEHNPDAPHRPYSGGINLTIPESIETEQRYYIVVVADEEDLVEEYDERNNTATQTTPLFVRAPSDADKDLEPYVLEFQEDGYCPTVTGQIIKYTVDLREHALPRTAFSFNIKFYLSSFGSLAPDSPLVYTKNIDMPYAAASTNPTPILGCMGLDEMGIRLVGGIKGWRYVIMIVDADNDVIEFDEENNRMSVRLPRKARVAEE